MAHRMDDDERRAFLGAGTRTGKVATVRKDRRPHVVPIWFVLDGDDLVFMTGATSVKGHALRRDGRVALSVDDETPPYAFVLAEGTAELSDDVEAMLPWSIRIAERYVGAEQAEAYGRRNAVDGELLVRVRVSNWLAISGLAD